ncbi:MAG: quinone-interacting membrane-bound oxidoreductase complex subunit QmoC [Thermodesulfovibrionales bacterium]|jgi:quinone-modifying oxidoreductase subunit QmoC|nr:quinone-interacting membrane-bound oxidoreductase complex subunit QmoC [Thermodesulfovibrionales bacterium]
MAEQVISPDLKFVEDVIASGGGDLKKCYQCATCTVVCNVTPDNKPFPRKEMIYAQWGMKDKLISNPDIWLCHQCSDCTAYCPRGAKPGEVLGAVRKLAIQHYSPTPLSKMVGDPKYLLILFAIPVLLFLSYIVPKGYLDVSAIPRGEDGGIVYSKFMPVFPQIDVTFGAAAFFAAVCFVLGIKRYWTDMSSGVGAQGNIADSIKTTISEILAHKRFEKCNVTKDRKIAHLLVFYAFVGLAITTTWAIVYLYGFHYDSPYPLYDPLKLLGNASALALLYGITLVTGNRLKNAEKAGKGSYFDWLFITVIYAIVVTGILSELLRLANIATLAYPTYFAHLVFVFFLFAYAPFSKMAHMVYRATAMVFARHTNRES